MEQNFQIDKGLFAPLTDEEKVFNKYERPSISYWAHAWRRLKNNRVALISLIVIIAVILSALIFPEISKYAYDATNLQNTNKSPSLEHLFGTDNLGRDLFVRVMFGARYSLLIAFSAGAINLVVGVVYGGIAGFAGGKLDNFMMRIVDILYSIPSIIYVVLLMAALKSSANGETPTGIGTIILALAISYWVSMARIVRGDILQLKQQDFVLAARSLGASKTRILFRHLIPNAMGSIIVTLTLLIPQAIFLEAFLSYLGLGLNAPLASLGTLANDAMKTLYTYPYQLLFPAATICIIILAFNLLGDGLSEALDPKHQR